MDTSVAPMEESEDEADVLPRKLNNNYKSLLDSESEEEPIDQSLNKSKSSAPPSSDSEKESPSKNQHASRRKNSNPKKKILPVKTQRKSAAKAVATIKEKMSYKQEAELKQKIQSEKQRMEREQEIRVPYHKPKQYTLKEFLSRKSLNMPSMDKIKQGQIPDANFGLNLRGEELEKFAQRMKEREEEALEFFRSESESDDDESENQIKENKENIADNCTAEKSHEQGGKIAESPTETEKTSKLNETELVPEETNSEVSETEKQDGDGGPELPGSNAGPNKEAVTAQPEIREVTYVPETEADVLDRLREKYKNVPSDSTPKISTFKSLQGMGPNDVIDLETGLIRPKILSGPEMLFQRYLHSVRKPKPKETVCMNILTVENGKLENQKVEVKLDKEAEFDTNRPGFSREMFKQKLRDQILMKRREEHKKKIQKSESIEFEPEEKPAKDLEDQVDEMEGNNRDEEVEDEDDNESEGEEDEEEENEVREKKKATGSSCAFLDDQAVDEDASENDSEDEETSSSSEEEEPEPTLRKKGRILKAFVDSDDEEIKSPSKGNVAMESEVFDYTEEIAQPIESEVFDYSEQIAEASETECTEKTAQPLNESTDIIDPFATQDEINPNGSENVPDSLPSDFTFTEPSVSEEIIHSSRIKDLCDSGPSQLMDDDFLDILSGRFADTQPSSSAKVVETEPEDNFRDSQFVSQVPESEVVVEDKVATPERNPRKLLVSSDDEEDNAIDAKKQKRKKKRKQKVKKLEFSDDEDDSIPQDFEEEVSDEMEECEDEEEQEEVLVDYDSEENEIEVKMKKKDLISAANKYVEQEAELSESEWGSADEDEKNLDQYDIELADEEEFDQKKLQEEVGRIHARKVLDDDIRNVKKIEELLFENEENDGVGRVRKFKWANQKSISLEDENARDGDALEDDDSEDEREIMYRKMRHERETMLREQSQKMNESDTISNDFLFLDPSSQTLTTSNMSLTAKRKFKIVRSASTVESLSPADTAKQNSTFLIKTANPSKLRNSFLARGEETLSRIAKFISHKDDEVTNLSHGSNSMSFATIAKPDESKKRKSDGPKPQEPTKKRKVEKNGKSTLLDMLK